MKIFKTLNSVKAANLDFPPLPYSYCLVFNDCHEKIRHAIAEEGRFRIPMFPLFLPSFPSPSSTQFQGTADTLFQG